MTVAEFLLARIAEDESGEHDYWCSWNQVPDSACDCPRRRRAAECDAKRRIVRWATSPQVFWPEEVLSLLALPYADHPDYRQEWKP